MCPEDRGVGFGEGLKGEMISLGPIQFFPPLPLPLACERKIRLRSETTPPPIQCWWTKSVCVCDIYNIEPGWGERGDSKDVDAFETKYKCGKIHKESSVPNAIGQVCHHWTKRENFGKTDQAIGYRTATVQILGVRCCGVLKKKNNNNNNNPVAEANRGRSYLHVICRYEKKVIHRYRDYAKQTTSQKLVTGIQSNEIKDFKVPIGL